MSNIIKDSKKPKIGIGSFAFRYTVGNGNFKPQKPMSPMDFLIEAHNMGFEGVLLCENLNYMNMNEEELIKLKEKAQELGLFIEVGMKDILGEGFQKHLEIANILSSSFLRVVLGRNSEFPESGEKREELIKKSIKILKATVPYCENKKLKIGIENHYDLPTDDLLRIVEAVDSPWVGLIFDSTNALGFIEQPKVTLSKIGKRLLSIHLKDFIVQKIEAGYYVTGAILGDGWLDIDEILKTAFVFNPDISIILEMTNRRDDSLSIEETLKWEKESIKKSLSNLREKVCHMDLIKM